MKKYIIALCAIVILSSCQNQGDTTTNSDAISKNQEVLTISSSIIPISSVINMVGWGFVDVNTIIPAGVSPHWFDISPRDLVTLEKSDITFLIGLEQIDGFLEKPLEGKRHVELAEWMELLEATGHNHSEHDDEHHDEEHEHDEYVEDIYTGWNQEIHGAHDEGEEHHHDDHSDEEHEDHEHDEDKHDDEHEHDEHSDKEHKGEEDHHDEHSVDAHVWLGKDNIIMIAKKIRDELSDILPEQAEYFSANVEVFTADIENIYTTFKEDNEWKTPREFIVFHDAYNYMMQSAGIDINLKVPFSENVLHQTGTAHMAELIEEIELHWVQNIFTEPQFSDGNVEKFAQQYNLSVGTLDPIGADESASWYLKNLQENLSNLSLIYE